MKADIMLVKDDEGWGHIVRNPETVDGHPVHFTHLATLCGQQIPTNWQPIQVEGATAEQVVEIGADTGFICDDCTSIFGSTSGIGGGKSHER
jgi:hypothetical protein